VQIYVFFRLIAIAYYYCHPELTKDLMLAERLMCTSFSEHKVLRKLRMTV
jgi:hypothetical protein